eukprot:scaffold788_cov231-Pinguiococcus_pyrenoidosus.AAC.9
MSFAAEGSVIGAVIRLDKSRLMRFLLRISLVRCVRRLQRATNEHGHRSTPANDQSGFRSRFGIFRHRSRTVIRLLSEPGIVVRATEKGVPSGRKSCAVEYDRAYQLQVVLTYLVSFHTQRQGDR